MKHIKKLAGILLALVMMLAVTAGPALAAAPTYTLTINNTVTGHTYEVYQIFQGTVTEAAGQKILSDVTWGSSVTYQEAGAEASEVAKALTDKTLTLDDFLAKVTLNASFKEVNSSAEKTVINGLPGGYYLVKDKDNSLTGDAVYTEYIIKIVGDATAQVKGTSPTVEKEIKSGASTGNSANIGDTLRFALTATLPNNLSAYETYKLVFTDTLSAGLTFAGNLKVYVGDTEVGAGFTADTTGATDAGGGSFTVTLGNVKALTGAGGAAIPVAPSSTIRVEYDAVLNEKAVIGQAGNSNKVKLTYSNDPHNNGSTGETPEDEEKVYSWEIPVFKYTGTNTPLSGAGFTLYTDAACTQAVNLVQEAGTTNYKVCKKADCSHTAHMTQITTDSTGRFHIQGLAQGGYYLKETAVPAGYNALASAITVVIGENGAITQDGSATSEVSIVNNAGPTLPETGGVGTTVFYVVGSVLVIAAVVLLVTKKRMNAEK